MIDFSGNPIDSVQVNAMTDSLAHRGPDDSGLYCEGNIGLGHRRLAILDLSPAGHQPMSNADQSIWIVFNGEIYNFHELRADLVRAGYSFRSNSDTEVIIHGYQEWGNQCWGRLEGMFALALWDERQKKLTLVRDPFGIKPLYYTFQKDRVIFGSEIKSVLASDRIERELNFSSLSHYLTYFYTPGPETILKDVFHVRPGHAITFDCKGANEYRYWQLQPDDSLANLGPQELYEMIRSESREAIRKSLVSDVPVGLLLSSGLDSNIILSELLALRYPDIETITVGFREDSFDEATIVNERIKGMNVKSHIDYTEDQDIPAMFDHMIYHLDSLSANFANLAEYLIVKSAARYVKVALAGAGNDELFAGYSTYIADRIRPNYLTIPGFIRSLIRAGVQHLPQTGRKYSFDYLLRKFTEGAGYSRQKSHYWWRTIFTDMDKTKLFSEFADPAAQMDSFALYDQYYKESEKGFDFPTQSLYADLFMFCNENANMMVDNLSMAFSLEVRPPFLTKRFVEFAFKIPYQYKLRGTTTKYGLRKAYEKQLPAFITKQKKSGLVSPIPQLLRGQLKELTLDTFANLSDHPYFDKKYIKQMLDAHMSGIRDHGFQIYILLTFLRWHQMFK